MTALKFPYLKYLVTPESVKPAQYVYRPVVPVELSLGQKVIVFDALIDSGADECTFPGWIIKTLGCDLYSSDEKKIFRGIGGSVLTYKHKTYLGLGGYRFFANVYYSHEWDDMPFGLLGQAGFFSHFNIQFDYSQKVIALKVKR